MCYFLPFYLLNSPKNQNFKKLRKSLEISSFYNSVPKIMILCYILPEIWHVKDVIIFHFGSSFAILPLNSPKNQNLKNMKKLPGDIILHKCTKNYDPGFKLAVCNLQFAKRFGSLQRVFAFFLKLANLLDQILYFMNFQCYSLN